MLTTIIQDTASAAVPSLADNDSIQAGPSAFAPQPDETLFSNLSGNQSGDSNACSPRSSGDHGGGADPSEDANDAGDTHGAPLDVPGPLNDPSSPTAIASDIPSGDVEDLWQQETIRLTDLRTAVDFIKGLQNPTLLYGLRYPAFPHTYAHRLGTLTQNVCVVCIKNKSVY